MELKTEHAYPLVPVFTHLREVPYGPPSLQQRLSSPEHPGSPRGMHARSSTPLCFSFMISPRPGIASISRNVNAKNITRADLKNIFFPNLKRRISKVDGRNLYPM